MIEIESCDSTCNCQTLTPSSIHSDRWDLIRVVVGQRELAELPESNWSEIACIDCDKLEVSDGKESLESFAERLIELGWAVDNVDRATAICRACSNAEDEATYASQYEDERGILG